MSKATETVQNVFSLLLQDMINLIHLWDYKKRGPLASKETESLNKTGYVKLNDFLSKSECDNLYNQIINLSEKYKTTTKLDNGTFISYRSDNTENGPDKGMIDIYNVDKSIEIKLDYSKIEKILKPLTTCDFYMMSIHAYVNRGVEGTRIFHVDNCQPVVYKAFIYLTDVEDISYGPYAFIKGTQRFSIQVYYNLFKNLFLKKYRSTDMPAYIKEKEIRGIGDKGSLIISNQNGIHRGYPQAKGKERVAIIVNYMVISKLNFIHKTAKAFLGNSIKKL